MSDQLPFDAQIEGNLNAVLTPVGGVKLYQLKANISAYLAEFANERVFCDLIGGYKSVAAFNEQMGLKRAEFAKVKVTKAPEFEPLAGPLTPGELG